MKRTFSMSHGFQSMSAVLREMAVGLIFGALLNSIAYAEGEVLPPEISWHGQSSDWSGSGSTSYVSSWPGDSPHDVVDQWVARQNQLFGGVRGNSIYTFTALPCTPDLILSSNGTYSSPIARASGCKARLTVSPSPACPAGASCNTITQTTRQVLSAYKHCVVDGYGNGSEFTLTSAPTYGECTCPKNSTLVAGKCVPIFDRIRKPSNMCAGNPIQPGTGNKRQVEPDYTGGGFFPLSFSRVYNSGPSYRRWRSTFDQSITYYGRTGTPTAVLERLEGSFPFARGATAASWLGDPDVNYKLSFANNQYAVKSPDGTTTENYSTTSNLLQNVRLANATNIYTLTYSTSATPPDVAMEPNLLIRVSDPFGHALNFAYDASGRRKSMTDPAGGLYQYAYSANGNLERVTYPDVTSRQYLYNESAHTSGANLPEAMTGIIDETGNRYATFAYTAGGLAVSTEHASGIDRFTVNYGQLQSIQHEPVFDGSGNIKYVVRAPQAPFDVTVTDSLGQSRSFGFVSSSGAIKTTGTTAPVSGACSETPLSQSYDANGNVSSTTDFNGTITNYTYNLSRNLETSRTDAVGAAQSRTITTSWHSSFRLPVQINEPGRRTAFTYDNLGNVLTKTDTDTATNAVRVWTYTYNSFGQVLTANGPRTDVSDITTFTYYNCTTGYQCGQVQTVTNALNQTTTYNTYNAHGQPLTMTDPNGVVTTLVYDARQRLTSRTVSTEVTTMEYWPTGLLKKVTLPDSTYIDYTYDAARRLIGINDSEGNRIAYTLDAVGNRTKTDVYDPLNALTNTRSQVFDSLSRLAQDLTASASPSEATTFGYDNNGNQTAVNAPLGRNSTNVYDELNRLKQVTDPNSGVTQYGYNALDQLISVTDPRSKVTNYTYNALGDLTQQVSPDTGTTTNTFDSAGNLKTSTDSRSKTATYSYDVLNRVTQVSYPDQTIAYHYDLGVNGKGRLSDVTDNSGQTQWSYDSLGRVSTRTQTTTGVLKQLSYGYDGSGRLSSVTLPSGHFVQYGYTNGKVTSLTLDGSTPILNSVLYEPFGPSRGWTWGNNTLAVRDFDQDGKVTLIDSAGLKTYGHDNAFRITGITDVSDATKSQTYGYDSLDRLTTTTGTALNDSFTYDANGNRLTQGGNQSSTYAVSSTNNRINSITGALSKTYTYDNAGNTLSDGTRTYTYNDAGRMVSATNAGITTAYTYNALGQRVKKTNSATTRYFVYDEAGHLTGEYDDSGALIQELVWFGDAPVAALRPNGSSVELFYIHSDHLNTPRRITKSSTNQILWHWDSDAFGTTMASENPSGVGVFVFNLRFLGQYFDSETGLHYNYYRDYDPQTGRYPSSDPIGLMGGINTYSYALSNPISFYDPYGLWVPPSLPQGAVNFSAGLGDTLLFSFGDDLRDLFSITAGIDKCSSAYSAGEWTGIAAGFAVGGVAGWRAAGQKAVGKEFSHWLPNRLNGPRSLWNGNYVTPARHYLHDPFRYPRGWRNLGEKWNPVLQQLDRIPNVFKGAGAGGAAAGAGAAMNNEKCGCER